MSAIAVVGLGALFPGGAGLRTFWHHIAAGDDLIGGVPASHWRVEDYFDPDPMERDKVYSRRGGFVETLDFDPVEFGIVPATLPVTDPGQLLGLVVAKQALADAQGRFRDLDRDRVSVILGSGTASQLGLEMAGRLYRPAWEKALRAHGLPEEQVRQICDRIAAGFPEWQESTFPGMLNNVVAGRIANRLDLGGTNYVIDAACASSLAAVAAAINELHLGHADAVLTGGVDFMNNILMYLAFSRVGALSRADDCRPFSAEADGTLLSEGIGMLVLRRLEDAERDGNPIYAVIRGCGTSSDGRARSIYAPRAEGQVKAYRRAYQQAGYGPESVELVEAHGTGTVAGDAAELASLHQVFQPSGRRRARWCALGSIKSQIGHAKGAAGAAGMVKAVLALQQGILPPTAKADQPCAELLDENSPFYLNTRARPWVHSDDQPRRAAVSAFGFGGTNFHLTLEEYRGPGRAARLRDIPTEVILIGGDDPGSVAARCRELAAQPAVLGLLEHLAYTTQQEWHPDWPVRVAVVAADAAELSERLLAAADRLSGSRECHGSSPARARARNRNTFEQEHEHEADDAQEITVTEGVHIGWRAEPGKIAFLFPGQGSQYVEMGAELAMFRPEAAAAWDLAARSDPEGAPRLHERVFPLPAVSAEERRRQECALRETEWAQPALGTDSLAALNVLAAAGVTPELAAGHSFGEVVALHAAGVLSAEGMLQVARARGRHMAAAAAGAAGAMTAVNRVPGEAHPASPGTREGPVRRLLEEIGGDLVIANHNSPQQIVLSGPLPAISAAEQRLAAAGITFARLPVATAFHSPMVAAAVAPFAASLEAVEWAAPRIPVIAGSTAEPFPDDPAAQRKLLAEQLVQPVRFAEQVERLYAMGARTFVEVGAGRVLTRLVDACLEGRPHRALSIDRKGADGVTSLWELLARLTAAGVPVRWSALWDGFAAPADPRAVRRSPGTIALNGALYGKPDPASLPPPASVELTAVAGEMEDTMSVHTTNGRTGNGRHGAILDAAFDAATERTPAWGGAEPAAHSSPEAVATWSEAAHDRGATDVVSIEDELPVVPGGGEGAVEILAQVQMAFQENMLAGHLEFLRSVEALAAPAGGARTDRPALPNRMTRPAVRRLPPPPTAYPPPSNAGMPAPRAAAAPSEPPPAFHDEPSPMPPPPSHWMEQARPMATTAASETAGGAPTLTHTPTRNTFEDEYEPAVPSGMTKEAMIEILLETVVEKTGYPREVLAMDMELEGELGIDSIKRLEILAAVQSRLPELPELPAERLGSLSTLAAIVACIEELQGCEEVPVVPFLETGSPGVGDEHEHEQGVSLSQISCPPAPLPGSDEALTAYRHVGRAEPEPACGFAAPGLLAGLVGITDDGRGIAAALAVELSARGVRAAVVDAMQPNDVLASLVILEGLREFAGPAEAAACHAIAFRMLRHLGPQLGRNGGLLAIVQDTGGRFGTTEGGPTPWAGGLSALAKSAVAEWPSLTSRALDVAGAGRDPAAVAAALAEELLRGGDEPEVGLAADGTRSVLRAIPREVRAGQLWLDDGDVVLAIGGARGVTAACLQELARHRRLRVAFTGRTRLQAEPPGLPAPADEPGLIGALVAQARAQGESPAPSEVRRRAREILANREIRSTLAGLEAAGSEAIYLSADVRDAAATAAAVAEVRRRWGGIQGLIHGAGVLADKWIVDKTDEQFDTVFGTKVDGLMNALAAVGEEPLKCLVLFSSVASRVRNPGQSDYAMANELLNQVAMAEARRRGPSCRVRSIAWGPWDSGMVTPEVRQVFQERGVPLLSTEDGARRFVSELTDAPGGEVVAVVWAPGLPEATRALRRAPSGPHPFLEKEPEEAGASSARFPVLVGARSYPYLRDHSIRGVPVLPLALAVEWFARAATRAYPEQRLAELLDLRVLRGVTLPEFEVAETVLTVVVEPGGEEGSVRLELRDAVGQARYAARGRLVPIGETVPAPSAPFAAGPAADGRDFPPGEAYAGRLFHGPEFRVIRDRLRLGSDSGFVHLDGVRERVWSGPWRVDMAALDGCLQLPLLWGNVRLGCESLPTSIARLVFCGDGPAAGVLACRCRVERQTGGLRAEVLLTDPNDRPLIYLEGAELTILPAPVAQDRQTGELVSR
jgi:acyl transferase domain-containing protein/NADP-dependent 3-hydroxy acid dehydrogenase YdfG/acyl carrier protein